MKHDSANARHDPLAKIIVIVEDDPDVRETIVQYLQFETSYQVFAVANGPAALDLVRTVVPHVFILNHHLGNMTGLQLIWHLRMMEPYAHTPIILMSAQIPLGAHIHQDVWTMDKPFELDNLVSLLAYILHE